VGCSRARPRSGKRIFTRTAEGATRRTRHAVRNCGHPYGSNSAGPAHKIACDRGRQVFGVLTVANLKGGSAKTTSAAFLAHAFHETRAARLCWSTPIPRAPRCAGTASPTGRCPRSAWPPRHYTGQLWGVIDPERWDTVVIDTPPLEERDGIVASTLRVATDVGRADRTDHDGAGPRRPRVSRRSRTPGRPAATKIRWCPFYSPVPSPTRPARKTVREILEGQGRRVLFSTVPRLERYAQAFGRRHPRRRTCPTAARPTRSSGGWGH